MNYQSCAAINKSFMVTDEGQVACISPQALVKNSMHRAYIFTNLFFYDITQREIDKIGKKIRKVMDMIVESSEYKPDDVDQLFPNISAHFRTELGNNSLDPLIKLELAKVKPTMMLQLSIPEQKKVDQMHIAICTTEIEKFKKAVLVTQDNKGKPYEIVLSPKYVANLPGRCRRFLKPTIKMLAYMDGWQFDRFEISSDYVITYTWAPIHPEFDEAPIKEAIKAYMSAPDPSNPFDL